MTENPLTEHDLVLLRQAIAVSEQAKARGDHPFGACWRIRPGRCC